MNGYANREQGPARQSIFGRPALPRPGTSPRFRQQEIHAFSRRWTQELFAFLLLSTGVFALRGVDLLAPLEEGTRVLLGCPPPPGLTTLVLSVYLFSTAVLILDRVSSGTRPQLQWRHLAGRAVFFVFYAVANALNGYFIFVFVAGLLLFGLELLNIYAYSLKVLPDGKELPG